MKENWKKLWKNNLQYKMFLLNRYEIKLLLEKLEFTIQNVSIKSFTMIS